jgi:hypothetical protein
MDSGTPVFKMELLHHFWISAFLNWIQDWYDFGVSLWVYNDSFRIYVATIHASTNRILHDRRIGL